MLLDTQEATPDPVRLVRREGRHVALAVDNLPELAGSMAASFGATFSAVFG